MFLPVIVHSLIGCYLQMISGSAFWFHDQWLFVLGSYDVCDFLKILFFQCLYLYISVDFDSKIAREQLDY